MITRRTRRVYKCRSGYSSELSLGQYNNGEELASFQVREHSGVQVTVWLNAVQAYNLIERLRAQFPVEKQPEDLWTDEEEIL